MYKNKDRYLCFLNNSFHWHFTICIEHDYILIRQFVLVKLLFYIIDQSLMDLRGVDVSWQYELEMFSVCEHLRYIFTSVRYVAV